jgi:hypothetical protein
MKQLSKEQLIYLAGFIDGDGSIMAQILRKADYTLKYQIRVSVTCVQKMTRYQHLVNIQNEIGFGTLRDREDGIGEYAIVGPENVAIFLEQLIPYLRLKKVSSANTC